LDTNIEPKFADLSSSLLSLKTEKLGQNSDGVANSQPYLTQRADNSKAILIPQQICQ
jgi:hypothetical protein